MGKAIEHGIIFLSTGVLAQTDEGDYRLTGPIIIQRNNEGQIQETSSNGSINIMVQNGARPSVNIFGGSPAPYGKYPQVCQLITWFDPIDGGQEQGAACSASIVNEFTVMTSAHCLQIFPGFTFKNRTVYCGIANSPVITGIVDYYHQFRNVINTVSHPDFVLTPFSEGIEYDIALLQLEIPLVFNDFVQPIIPWDGVQRVPEQCATVGFGVTATTNGLGLSPVMREVSIKVRTIARCMSLAPPPPVTANNICFFNSGPAVERACGGDSGGPTFCGQYQVGITTYEYEDCTIKSFGGSMNVSKFIGWIKENSFHF